MFSTKKLTWNIKLVGENKSMENSTTQIWIKIKAGSTVLMSDKEDFKTSKITRDKKGILYNDERVDSPRRNKFLQVLYNKASK